MNPATLWLTKTCLTFLNDGNCERRSSVVADKNAKSRWAVFERSYSYLRLYLLTARLPELKLERLDCSHLLNSEHRSKLSTDYSSGERWYGVIEVQFVEKTGAVANEQSERYYAVCKCCLSIFTKTKLLVMNRDSLMVSQSTEERQEIMDNAISLTTKKP